MCFSAHFFQNSPTIHIYPGFKHIHFSPIRHDFQWIKTLEFLNLFWTAMVFLCLKRFSFLQWFTCILDNSWTYFCTKHRTSPCSRTRKIQIQTSSLCLLFSVENMSTCDKSMLSSFQKMNLVLMKKGLRPYRSDRFDNKAYYEVNFYKRFP